MFEYCGLPPLGLSFTASYKYPWNHSLNCAGMWMFFREVFKNQLVKGTKKLRTLVLREVEFSCDPLSGVERKRSTQGQCALVAAMKTNPQPPEAPNPRHARFLPESLIYWPLRTKFDCVSWPPVEFVNIQNSGPHLNPDSLNQNFSREKPVWPEIWIFNILDGWFRYCTKFGNQGT